MARAVADDFSEFEVLDWYPIHQANGFHLEEVACLMMGLDWTRVKNRINNFTSGNKPLSIERLEATIRIRERELLALDCENPGILIECPAPVNDVFVMISPYVDYTKESIKAFLLHCFPDERPQFLYPDALPPLSEEEATQKELRELRAQVKQLQKLALGLSIDLHDYNPASGTNRGMVQLEATLANAEDSFNRMASPTKKINIRLGKETIKKYLTLAYEAVKVQQ